MTIQAVYFDLGGVIVRTEFQAPRQHLAERFEMEYDDLVKMVFDSETSAQASLGLIREQEHWVAVARRCTCRNRKSSPYVKNFSPVMLPTCAARFYARVAEAV